MTEYLYETNGNGEEITTGASIDLKTLHQELGFIPHPGGLCENPDRQQAIWIALAKNLKANKLRGIPHIRNWIGTNIGYYNDDTEFVSTAEDDEIDINASRYFVFWA